VSFFERRADLAAIMFFFATASLAAFSNSERQEVRCWICGSIEEMSARIEAILASSGVIGDGSGSEGDLNLTVCEAKENAMADRSRARCVNKTERSLLLKVSTPIAGANVEANSSVVKIRDVFEVATLDASSNIAFAAA
jgi:hypothetical protein